MTEPSAVNDAAVASAPLFVGETTCDAAYVRDAFTRLTRTRLRRTLIIYGFLFAGLFAVTYRRLGGFAGFDANTILFLVVILGALLAVPPLVTRLTAGKAYRSSPHRDRTLRFSWSDDGLHLKSPTTEGRISWAAFLRVVRFKDGLLLFQSAYHATWAPDALYRTPADAAAVVALVRSRVKRFQD